MVKILQLYDLNHNKLNGLTNYKELKVEREINVNETLSFLYPNSDHKRDLIQEECYIRTKDNEFVVKEINISDDDWTEYICKINLENVKGNFVAHFETVEQSCTNAVNLALVGTGWTIGSCDVTKLRTTRKNNSTSYAILQEIQSAYSCEMTFDSINKNIYIYQSMGSDKGTYFSEQLNLKKLDVQRNSYDYITRLIPFGKDGLGIASINGGLNYIENYQYSNKEITACWEDNRYTDTQSLLEDSIVRLNYLSKPYKSYKADVIDLANINTQYSILDYDLGDTITLLSKSKNTKEKQRIVKITEYPEEPEKNFCEIANKILRLEDLQMKFIESADIVDTVTTSTGEIDGTKVDSIEWSQLQNIHIVIADIQDLNAVTARIGTLEVTTATITQLNATNASIVNLQAEKANITDIVAINATINVLEVDVASINNLLAGNIGANNLAAGAIQAGSAIIANAAIGSAQIISLDVVKLNAGTMDTSKITIAGPNGRLKITGNRLQVFAGTITLYERVSVGDVNGDGTVYGFRVRGADGTTILLDETGVKREGITDGSINNAKISGDANIDGTKLDIASVVTSINGGVTTITSNKIAIDGSTLDIKYGTLATTVTTQGTTIASHTTSISQNATNINLKVATTTYNTKMTSLDNNINNINTSLSSHSSSINLLNNAIVLKVTQTDVDTSINEIEIGGRNLLYNTNKPSVITPWASFIRIVLDPILGENVFEVYASTTVERTCRSNRIELDASTQYTFSMLVRKTSNVSSMDVFLLSRKIGESADYTIVQAKGSIIPLVDNWTQITWTFTTNSLADNGYIRIDNNGSVDGVESSLFFTEVKFEKGNKATDWSPAPEDIQIQIDDAQTKADDAFTNAETANGLLSDIASDDKLTPTEKQGIKLEWDSIVSEVTKNDTQATSFSITTEKTAYDTAYSALSTYITPLLTSLTITSDIVGTTFRTKFVTYYDARTILLNAISLKVKANAETANTNAQNAQTSADTANSDVYSLTTRVSTAESSITAQAGQIALKVSTSTFDTFKKDGGDEGNFKIDNKVIAVSGWYRIASNLGNRAFATFTITDTYSSKHQTAIFNCGIHYANNPTLILTGLSNYGALAVTKARIVKASTYNAPYLEIYVTATSAITVWCTNNVQTSGWAKVNLTLGEIPIGYSAIEFDINSDNVVDVTSQNTSNDTANVNGVSSSQVTTRLSNAETAITQNATDISLRATQTSLNTTNANVTTAQTAANTANGTANTLRDTTIPALTSRVSAAEIKITPTAIVSTVTQSTTYLNAMGDKSNKATLISEINQSAEAITISASKLNLAGYATFTSLSTAGATTINGSNITSGLIKGIQIQQINGATILLDLYKNANGGELSINDINGNPNVKIGSEAGSGQNIGGTITLFNDSLTKKRIAMGITTSTDSGVYQALGSNGNVRAVLDAQSSFGVAGVFLLNTAQDVRSYLTETNLMLDGVLATEHSLANSLAKRNASGDLNCRLVRTEYQNESSISDVAGLVLRNNNTTDNYLRTCTSKTAIANWLGMSGVNSQSGYQKFPNGMILQWGAFITGTLPANTQTITSITIPLTFPNNFHMCTASYSPNYSNNVTNFSTYPSGKSIVRCSVWTGSAQILTFRWLAIGY